MGKEAFGIKFTNTTDTPQSVKLFELGATGEGVPIQTQVQNSAFQYTSYITFGVNPAWLLFLSDFQIGVYNRIKNSSVICQTPGMPTSCLLTFSDGTTTNIADEITSGDDLDEVVSVMGNRIATHLGVSSQQINVTAKAYYNPSVRDEEKLKLDFTVNYSLENIIYVLRSMTYLNYGVSVGVMFPFLDSVPSDGEGTWEVGGTITPNGVEIESQTGTSYAEIQESQNGSVLEIDYLDVNTYSGVTDEVRQTQLLNCLKFEKKNANGDDSIFFRCPTIDAYQYQDTLRYIGLNKETDRYTLEGSTAFEYTIEGNASVSLDFSYIKLPNITLGNKYKVEKIVD